MTGLARNLNRQIDRYGIARMTLAAFLFMQPFAGFAGVRNTLFVILCLLFAVRVGGKRFRPDLGDKTVLAFLALAAVSFISSVSGPYAMESLDAIRKNLLYQAVVFSVILCEYRSFRDMKPLFYAMIAGFSLLSLVIVFKYDMGVLLDWIAYAEKTGGKDRLLGGYSNFAAFYIPFGLGYVISSDDRRWIKWALLFVIFLGFVLTVLNNHRTQLAAVVVSAAAVTLISGRYRAFLAGVAVLVAASFVIVQARPGAFDRYKTLLDYKTYISNEHRALNDRLSIWKGAADMIAERPVLGWGYGWKKIALVAREKGFLERWDKEGRTFLYFSKAGYGAANPHNLVLQILFEIGFLGLLAFLFLWLTVLKKAASAYRAFRGCARGAPEAARFLRYGVIGVLVSYALINATNGFWQEGFGNLIFSFAAIAVVAHNEGAGPAEAS